jgi:hypothetical protein
VNDTEYDNNLYNDFWKNGWDQNLIPVIFLNWPAMSVTRFVGAGFVDVIRFRGFAGDRFDF